VIIIFFTSINSNNVKNNYFFPFELLEAIRYVCEVVSLTCLTACLGYVCEVVFNVFDCLFVRLFSACLTAGLGYAEAAGGNNCQRTGAELT